MALFKPGFGISALSGKNGGTIYSRNRGGQYSKAWANPMGTPTDDQTDKMEIWITMGATYNSLNRDQINLWEEYAQKLTAKNRLGDPIKLTAQQTFCECFTNASLIGETPLTEPGEATNRPAITNAGYID